MAPLVHASQRRILHRGTDAPWRYPLTLQAQPSWWYPLHRLLVRSADALGETEPDALAVARLVLLADPRDELLGRLGGLLFLRFLDAGHGLLATG